MPRYACEGFRAVEADIIGDAAGIFARRLARKSYGRRGDVRVLARNSWAEDGTRVTYQAFIGITDRNNVTVGHTILLTVSRIGD